MLKHLNVLIPGRLFKRLKLLAVAEDRTIKEIVTEALERYLKAKTQIEEEKEKKEEVKA